jgi:quinol monooxygenase YgiN
MPYGYIGSMKAQPGKRDEVVAILLAGVDGLKRVGCSQYTVGVATDDDVTIWASEVWESREAHETSLELPETKEAIAKAMPMLTPDFSRVETDVRGGLGL